MIVDLCIGTSEECCGFAVAERAHFVITRIVLVSAFRRTMGKYIPGIWGWGHTEEQINSP